MKRFLRKNKTLFTRIIIVILIVGMIIPMLLSFR